MFKIHRALPFVVLTLFPISALSQSVTPITAAHVIPVPLDFSKFAKSKLYVLRGDRLMFTGNTSHFGGLNVTIKAGGNIITHGQFDEKCDLLWDSAKERYAGRKLLVYVSRGNSLEVYVAQIDVTILDKSPFDFSAVPAPTAKGKYSVHIKPTSDVRAESYALYCDEKRTSVVTPATGDGELDLTMLTPGKHIFCLKAQITDGGELEAGYFNADVPARVTLAIGNPTDTIDLRSGSPILKLTTTPDADIIPVSAEYLLDGRLVVTKTTSPVTLSLDLSHSGSGAHKISVTLITKEGQRLQSAEVQFHILRDIASDYHLWKMSFKSYYDRQSADSRALERIMKTNFEGTKQTNLSISEIQAMLLRNETAMVEVANLDWPATLEQEDQRTLETARRELIVSFRGMQEVSRALQTKLGKLLSYDGTLSAAGTQFGWQVFIYGWYDPNNNTRGLGQLDILKTYSNTADQSIRNLELVERRGNLK